MRACVSADSQFQFGRFPGKCQLIKENECVRSVDNFVALQTSSQSSLKWKFQVSWGKSPNNMKIYWCENLISYSICSLLIRGLLTTILFFAASYYFMGLFPVNRLLYSSVDKIYTMYLYIFLNFKLYIIWLIWEILMFFLYRIFIFNFSGLRISQLFYQVLWLHRLMKNHILLTTRPVHLRLYSPRSPNYTLSWFCQR